MLLEAGEELFALPTAAVRRILQVGSADIGQLQQGPVAEVDGENIPLTPLSAMLQVPGVADRRRARPSSWRRGATGDSASSSRPCTKSRSSCSRSCAGRCAIRRRSPAPPCSATATSCRFSTSTRSSTSRRAAPSADAAPALPRRAPPRVCRVLVVDDSLVAGELQKNILLAAGYESEIASDGVEALECLHRKEWDLVVADVDMPRMTGFELTERIRADEQFRDIPVIIVTSRDTVDDRRRGFEVGRRRVRAEARVRSEPVARYRQAPHRARRSATAQAMDLMPEDSMSDARRRLPAVSRPCACSSWTTRPSRARC